MEFLAAFCVFGLGVLGMSVGVMANGRRLKSSCGGLMFEGEEIGDCHCARKQNDLCTSDEGNELVKVAEMGWPSRRDAALPVKLDDGPPRSDERLEV